MFEVIKRWYQRYFSDPEAIVLLVTLVILVVVIWLFGDMLAPVLVSIIIAYLLEGSVKFLEKKWKCPHILAVSIVCLLFIGLLLLAMFWLIPILWEQLTNLINELPNTISRSQSLLLTLPQKYPRLISADQITYVTTTLKAELASAGKAILSFSLASIPGIIEVIVYAILVPLMIFFFLKDSDKIIHWFTQFIPKKSRVLRQVWAEINQQMSNYIRARVLEMLIVGFVTALTFKLFGLQYAILLGVLVGVSTIIPYIGAIVSTIPVVVVAFMQWGWSAHFAYLIIAYTVISILDSNVLVPLLFSETLNLHPIAIIIAVIFFGSLWGFWGVFFAIPLATVIQAVLVAWPTRKPVAKKT